MMVNGRDEKDLFTAIFFGKHLNNVRQGSSDQRQCDHRQSNQTMSFTKRIGHKSDNARLRHIKSRRRDIKPKKSQNAADNHSAKRRQINLTLLKGDNGISGKHRRKNTASQTINTINHAAGIKPENYQNKQRNKPPADL